MVAKDFPPKPLQDNTDLQEYSDDESEETLSFCDLSIYNDGTEWDNFSKEYSSDDQQDMFEFSSQDSSISTFSTEKNIIFCGKLIPYKEPVTLLSQETHHKVQNRSDPKKGGALFQSKSSFNKSKSSLWHLLLFGALRPPSMEMELSDIRNRQQQRTPSSTMFRSSDDRSTGQEVRLDRTRSRGKRFWRVLKDLSCRRSHHTNTLAKASLDCISSM